MSFPGVIKRPLEENEFSIYLDNSRPIPLTALATFLSKIDKEARAVEGMDGRFLELSDFALGSNELRFRVIGPGRFASERNEREERNTVAAEKTARNGTITAGAAVVSAVVAVVTVAIATGNANPSAHRIVNQYNVQNVFIRGPKGPPEVITRDQIEAGRDRRISKKGRMITQERVMENDALQAAMHEGRRVELAGWLYLDRRRGPYFETMYGNHLPVYFDHIRDYEGSPVAVQAVVHGSRRGLELEVVEVITRLSNF